MSSLATAMDYQETGTLKSKKNNIRVIGDMSTKRIVMFLAYRHRVGLLVTGNIVLVGFILNDKFGWVLGLIFH